LWLDDMSDLDCHALGLDWTANLGKARAQVGEGPQGKALQGNIDPNVLFASPEQIDAEVARVINSFGRPHQGAGTGASHIFNLGHGISQFTNPEHVIALSETVVNHSKALRNK
jgi:uroporphyrinogen decarboxylase